MKTNKTIPVVIFVLVTLIVGLTIFLITDSKFSANAQNQNNNQSMNNTNQNSDPIDNIDMAWTKGPEDAKIKIIEYSEFQCPFCKKGADTIGQIYEKYSNDIQLTFVHFPLTSIHPQALQAAKAAEAAGYQGKFWEMHDLLFANQSNLTREDILSYAKKLELDIDKFERYFDNTNIEDKIKNNMAEIEEKTFEEITVNENGEIVVKDQEAKIQGVPAFLINGRLLAGAYPFESFEKVILDLLK